MITKLPEPPFRKRLDGSPRTHRLGKVFVDGGRLIADVIIGNGSYAGVYYTAVLAESWERQKANLFGGGG